MNNVGQGLVRGKHTELIKGYQTMEILGRGAGSSIHKVRCRRTGRVYALKQAKRQNDADGRVFEQIRTEYKTAQHVSHPALRQVHQLKRIRRRFRVVELRMLMQYLDGQTLEQVGDRDLPRLVGYFGEVATALRAMHEQGFVHADMKPNNIMVLQNQKIALFDFGQSCPIGTVKPRIQGTPDFIAPEQVLRMPLDARTDIFNLGATMYWCLTDKTFPTRIKSQQPGSAFNLDRPGQVPAPQEINPEIPGVLSDLVMDCCRNGPQHRPADMQEVLRKLGGAEHVLQRQRSPSTDSLDSQQRPPEGPD